MGKLLGLLMVVLGIWAGVQIYTEGARDAFGGALARFLEEDRAPGSGPGGIVGRASESVRQAQFEAAQRRDRLLPE